MKSYILTTILAFTCCHLTSAQGVNYENDVREIIEKFRVPGISLAYLNDNGAWESVAAGKANADSNQIVNVQTVFTAASLSKPVTAYLTLRLVQVGKIDLEKPLSEYFQYDDLVSKEGYKDVNAKMILTHTSGLPNWRQGDELNFKYAPGERFSYSGEGIVWLQNAIEAIEGTPFDQVARKLLFEPLDMKNSSFIWESRFESNFATPHDELMFPSGKWKPEKTNAAGSLQTNAVDYARFLQELIDPRLLSKDLRDQMLKQWITVKTYKGGKEQVIWGLGIGLQKTSYGLELWHWGNNGNIRSFFAVSPERQKGLVYFTNSKNGLAITEALTEIFLGTPQSGYKWNGFKGQGKLYRLKSTFKKKNTQ